MLRVVARAWSVGTLFALLTPSSTLHGAERVSIGMTADGSEVHAVVLSADDSRRRILLIGGLDGDKASTKAVERLLEWYEKSAPDEFTKKVVFLAVPNARPAGISTTNAGKQFPPGGGYYDAKSERELRYLWRWIGQEAPDWVIDVRAEKKETADDSLVKQLSTKGVEDWGAIPAVTVVDNETTMLDPAEFFLKRELPQPSQARLEKERRQKKNATEVAEELLRYYGRDLKQAAYIPALAVVGRMRFTEQMKQEDKLVPAMMQSFLRGEQNPVPKSGSDQAGHLLFAELAFSAEGADRQRWVKLVQAAAEQAFNENGEPRGLVPSHNEMSDAVFMSGPILAAAGRLTGEARYFTACRLHLEGMRKLCLRADGIYRHSPLDEAAWGRGNGFPALGMAWTLTHWPREDAQRDALIAWQQAHLRALVKHQDLTGCWHQVIDRSASYREFTCTAMISFAMLSGIREGYLSKEEFEPPALRGWEAIKVRIGPQGSLVDVCVGTGKQKRLVDYFERPASYGVDARGGAMALMLATEVMRYQSQR